VPDSPRLQFMAADLAQESLGSVLARSALRPGEPILFACIGVTMYLAREANLAVFRDIAAFAAPGSELVVTYVDEAALDPGHAASPAFRQLQGQVSAVGESFVSGFDPHTLPALLQGAGLALLEDVDGVALEARHDPAGLNRLRAAAEAHVAHVRR
jgi:O-methyltransferase involved in polyketide biosynthesis